MIDLTDVKVGDTLFDPGIRRYSHHKTPRPRTLYVIKVARQYLYASEDPNITDIKDFRVERLDRKQVALMTGIIIHRVIIAKTNTKNICTVSNLLIKSKTRSVVDM